MCTFCTLAKNLSALDILVYEAGFVGNLTSISLRDHQTITFLVNNIKATEVSLSVLLNI